MPRDTTERELLLNVARSALRTKLQVELADQLTEIVVDALLTIRRPEKPLDLFMVELMTMKHRVANESRLVKGLVLDHGARHPDMPKRLENCFVLTCNVSLEYEKSEVTAETKYADVAQRQKLVDAERRVVDDRVRRVIDLKRKVCDTPDKHFVVINQKGIDPMSLDMLAKEGILALRRAKRRNMERLTLACGGQPVNSFDDLTPDVLGRAGLVYEQVLGEDKYTFVEGVENPQSVTILLKAPTDYQLNQMKDAVRDGLRAVKNALEDACLVPGAGAFELAASLDLQRYADQVQGRARRGVLAYADALLVVPRTLAENAGLDPQDSLLALQDEHKKGHVVGLDLATGLPLDPVAHGIWDLYRVKRHVIQAATIVAQQLLLVDEILKAGKATGKDAS
jgi:T-complex protein 1 subunit zeta